MEKTLLMVAIEEYVNRDIENEIIKGDVNVEEVVAEIMGGDSLEQTISDIMSDVYEQLGIRKY